MSPHQREFFELALECGVLRFGEFKLKSGRVSPYFFNLGLITHGAAVAKLGQLYAEALLASGIRCDMLFGPAYKGIPLVTSMAIALAARGRDLPYAYNRKEAKDHGEGGLVVGAPLAGEVVIVDDVMTAGTAVRESIGLIERAGARTAAILIAFDRQERGQEAGSAVQEMAAQGIRVVSLVTLDDLVGYLNERGDQGEILRGIELYRGAYGA